MKRDKNNFALTPPMGWNSYDYYDTTVDEARVLGHWQIMCMGWG